MEMTVSNINPPTNEFPFITVHVQIQDTENLGQTAVFYLAINQHDITIPEIKDIARDKVKEFLSNILKEIDYI